MRKHDDTDVHVAFAAGSLSQGINNTKNDRAIFFVHHFNYS